MKYIPQSEHDRAAILRAIGLQSAEEIFQNEAPAIPLLESLDYPPAQSEAELRTSFRALAKLSAQPDVSFAGCGIYQHSIPSIVPFLQGRSEFATSYTPYQAEISQGLLQAIFEFQTLACLLTESELSNASVYDGATALAEAVLMGLRLKKKSEGKILISGALHPHYVQVLRTYCENFMERLEVMPLEGDRLSLAALKDRISSADMVVTQSPNLFGVVERYDEFASVIKASSALWITSTMEPFAFGLLRGPGAFGADIVTAEGQSFGNGPYIGGSSFGIFTCKQEYLRNLPGRLVGETVDALGRRSFTLTFATREQFIRRDKATSNICTNQNLNMLAGLIHMVTLGKAGIREVAERNFSAAQWLKREIAAKTAATVSPSSTFNEFVVDLPCDAALLVEKAAAENFVCGVDLGRFDAAWSRKLLVHSSEIHSRAELERLVQFLGAYAHK